MSLIGQSCMLSTADIEFDADLAAIDELLGHRKRPAGLEARLMLADPVVPPANVDTPKLVDRAEIVDHHIGRDQFIGFVGSQVAACALQNRGELQLPVGMFANQGEHHVIISARKGRMKPGPEKRHALFGTAIDLRKIPREEALVALSRQPLILVELVVGHHLRNVLAIVRASAEHVRMRHDGERIEGVKPKLGPSTFRGKVIHQVDRTIPVVEDFVRIAIVLREVEHRPVRKDKTGERLAAIFPIRPDAEAAERQAGGRMKFSHFRIHFACWAPGLPVG